MQLKKGPLKVKSYYPVIFYLYLLSYLAEEHETCMRYILAPSAGGVQKVCFDWRVFNLTNRLIAKSCELMHLKYLNIWSTVPFKKENKDWELAKSCRGKLLPET